MMGDTRAVSPAVTQALTIGIATILITGLLIGGASYIDNKRENTVRQGLQDVGAGAASDFVRLDQFDTAGVSQDLSFSSGYPDRIGGEGYNIHLVPGSNTATIHLNSTSSNLGTSVRFDNETAVCQNEVRGGRIRVVYDAGNDCLAVRDA